MRGAAGYGELLDALRGVTWPARRPARGSTSGTHRSRLRGISPEFTEYRPYRQGDDPRRLDWRLLARTDRAYLRITSDRATLPTLIVVDASASMAFPEDSLGKWQLAKQVAVGLASAAHASADPAGIVVVAHDGVHTLAPRTRSGVVGDMMRVLEGTVPRGSTPLAGAVRAAHDVSRLAIVTDLLGDADAMLAAARVHRAAAGEVHLVHVVAAEELDPPGAAMLATDPEDARLERALTETTRAAYQAAFAEWRSLQARQWTAAGVQYHVAVTGTAPDRIVRQVTDPRRVESARGDAPAGGR